LQTPKLSRAQQIIPALFRVALYNDDPAARDLAGHIEVKPEDG
jgi:hypothetical protein